MDRKRLKQRLRPAGLLLLPGERPPAPPPLAAVWLLVSCGPEEGRRDAWVDGSAWADDWVDECNPGLVQQANMGWFRLACEHGLFGPEREFLLGTSDEGTNEEWLRVRLLDEWDLMGAGAESRLLGSRAGCPEFVMSSLDGRIVMRATTYQRGVSSIVMAEPWRAPTIRTHMDRIVEQAAQPNRRDVSEWDRAAAHDWLLYVQHHAD